jgi:muramoyltetrapeptide carboxypeptidase
VKPLQKGDLISVTAPSSHFPPDEYKKALNKIKNQLGLSVFETADIFSQHGNFAGTDAHRSAALLRALIEPKSKAVFFVRGGYGVAPLLRSIFLKNLGAKTKSAVWAEKRKFVPRIMAGYSDHTVLLNLMAQRFGWKVFHAPVLVGRSFLEADVLETESFQRALF